MAKGPVIVITGTPGTGKSTHAELVASASPVPLRHINVGELVKKRSLHSGYDEEWQSYTVDDDKVIDELEPIVADGGVILDWHTCDIFPESWVDLVVVLRCNHSLLWERLEKRNYALKKIQENNTSEIMQTVLEDARESYAHDIVVELQSDNATELDSNVARIVKWIETWSKDNERPRDDVIT